MHASQLGLDRPLDSVVHELASAQLERARVALVRAELEADPDGIRDFRAASGELRSLLHAYPQALEPTSRRASLRQLRRLAALTAPERDAEAQLQWLRRHVDADSAPLDATRGELERELEAARALGHARRQEHALPAFLALRKEILASTRSSAPTAAQPEASFARACANQLELYTERLQQRLQSAPPQPGEEGRARGARRAVRHLYGLLAPLRHSLAAARGALAQLRGLQGVLGELRMLRVLRSLVRGTFERAALERARARWDAIENPAAHAECALPAALLEDGCLEVGRSLESRRRQLSSALGEDWFGGASAPFFSNLIGIARELSGQRAPVSAAPISTAEPAAPALLATKPAQSESAEGGGALRATRGERGERYYRSVKQRFGRQVIDFEKSITRGEFEQAQARGEEVRPGARSRVRAPIQELLRWTAPERAADARADAAAEPLPEPHAAAAEPVTAEPVAMPAAAALCEDSAAATQAAAATAEPVRTAAAQTAACERDQEPAPGIASATDSDPCLLEGPDAEPGCEPAPLAAAALQSARKSLALARLEEQLSQPRAARFERLAAPLAALLLVLVCGGMVMGLTLESLASRASPRSPGLPEVSSPALAAPAAPAEASGADESWFSAVAVPGTTPRAQ